MTDIIFTTSTPYVRQIKEQSFEPDASGAYTVDTELPGFIEICVDVNGVPVVLERRKAPGLLADIARAQAAGFTPPATDGETREASWGDVAALASRVSALEARQQEPTPSPPDAPPPDAPPPDAPPPAAPPAA